MSGGGRIDSRELQVRFLFGEVKTGEAFVRSASILRDPEARARALAFAEDAHDAIVEGLERAPLTDEEREDLRRSAAELADAIRACRQR